MRRVAAGPISCVAPRSRLLDLRIEQLWELAALALPFMVTVGASGFASDSWWSVKMGQATVTAGRPVVDPLFAHAPAVPGATNQQWLAQVAIYLLYAGFGEIGARVAAGLLMAATCGLLLAAGRVSGGSARTAAFGVLLATLLAASNVTVRAQLFCYLLFGLTYFVLHLRPRRPRLLYLLPATLAVWANLHGSFALGLLLIGLHAVGDTFDAALARRKLDAVVRSTAGRWALLLAASFVATWLNPLGPSIYAYLGAVTTHPAVRSVVTEWQPTTIRDSTGLVLVASMLLLGAIMHRSARRIATVEALLLVAFSWLALDSLRSVVWWGLVAAPILARHAAAVPLPAWLSRTSPSLAGKRAHSPLNLNLNLALAALIVAQAALAPFWLPTLVEQSRAAKAAVSNASSTASTRPSAAAADVLAGLPSGSRLYHFQPWTGYLAWRLWPAQQPMLDARIEAHPPTVWADYFAVNAARADWEPILDGYGVDYLVLDPRFQGRLAAAAEASGRWTRLYVDSTAVVLGRRAP